jgi:hypothetical protein
VARDGDEVYADLAREIRDEVARAVEEGGDLSAAFDRADHRERERVARAAFDRLPAARQWEVLAELFDDDEMRSHLAAVHTARRAEAERRARDLAVATAARRAGRIDLDRLPDGAVVTLGLFRPEDVGGALTRGRASTVCARELVVLALPGPEVQVLEDLFNPRRGLFVTSDYDERTWADERLDGHARVRLGEDGPDGFVPALHPRGRVAPAARRGRLHLGFALVGDEDVFAAADVAP